MILFFSVIEFLIPTLISVWFAIAAIIMVPLAIFINDLYIEFPIFIFISIILILFTRPYYKKYLNKNKESFNASMVGESVKILKLNFVQDSNFFYDVKFKGSVWTAISSEKFLKDDVATIVEFRGNKILIKK